MNSYPTPPLPLGIYPIGPERDPTLPEYISKRAYQLFEDRGRQENDELGDWFNAEREVRQHFGLKQVIH